jgi:hypothetical protein
MIRATHVLRAVAVAIALLAAFDPTFVRVRRDRPLVSVVAADLAVDSSRAQRIVRALASRFTMVPGWLPAADAVVVVGEGLPAALLAEVPRAPVFVVPPTRAEPEVRWRAIWAPATARVGERMPIDVLVAHTVAEADSLEFTVRHRGVLLAREVVAAVVGWRERSHRLSVVASDTGAVVLEVTATLLRAGVRTDRSRLVQVRHDRMRVLNHDTRPTWFGTFVRRALSADARIDLTTRTTTSRFDGTAITTSVGAPPALSVLPAPPQLDVVVVGAAHALSDAELGALDRFARGGGSVLLLLDETPNGGVQRWLGVPAWRRVDRAEPQRAWLMSALGGTRTTPDRVAERGDASEATLLGRQWLVPVRLPNDGEPWMQLVDSSIVVWSRPVGAGTVVVAGALDAWTFRDATRSAFAELWPRLVAEASARIAPPVSMTVHPAVAPPGAWRVAEITAGDAEALDASWTLTLRDADTLAAAARARRIPLIARGDGRWSATWRDETETAGTSTLSLGASSTEMITIPVATRVGADAVVTPHASLLASLALATGGRVLESDNVGDVLDAVLAPADRQHPWQPMRSPWWLLPFAGALLAEWWLRRRAGRP